MNDEEYEKYKKYSDKFISMGKEIEREFVIFYIETYGTLEMKQTDLQVIKERSDDYEDLVYEYFNDMLRFFEMLKLI